MEQKSITKKQIRNQTKTQSKTQTKTKNTNQQQESSSTIPFKKPFDFLVQPNVPTDSSDDFIKLHETLCDAALHYRAPALSDKDRAIYIPIIVDKLNQLYCYHGIKQRTEEQDIELQMYITMLIDYITRLLTCPEDGSMEVKQDRRERLSLKNFFSLQIAEAQARINLLHRQEALNHLHGQKNKDGTRKGGRIETTIKRIERKKSQLVKERNSVPTIDQSMQAMQLEEDNTTDIIKDIKTFTCGKKDIGEIDLSMEDEKTKEEDDDDDPDLNEYETEDGDEGDEYSSDELEEEEEEEEGEGDNEEEEEDNENVTMQQ